MSVPNHTYLPRPIDVSHIVLSEKMESLIEQLARNSHEVWAASRVQQGWRYSPVRNDEKKEHPCLLPYDELAESEKNVDRQAETATLKAIRALGYQIRPDDK